MGKAIASQFLDIALFLSCSSSRDLIPILQATPKMIVCDERQKHKRGKEEIKEKGRKIRKAYGEQNVNYTNPFVGTRSEERLANVPVCVTIQCHLMA